MTCTRISCGIVCSFRDKAKRLHVGNRYFWAEFHSYLGPSFYTDRNYSNPYYPTDENDPIWEEFAKWNP